MLSIYEGLSALIAWMKTDNRMDMIYFVLAVALLLELTLRVMHRFVSDRRVKNAISSSNQRMNARMRRGPIA